MVQQMQGERGVAGKAQKLRVWEMYILDFRLTLSEDKVFHSQSFLTNSPGAIEHSIHRPGTLQLEERGFNCTNQREASSQSLPFSLLGPIYHYLELLSSGYFLTDHLFTFPFLILFVPLLPGPTHSSH